MCGSPRLYSFSFLGHVFIFYSSDALLFVNKVFSSAASRLVHVCELSAAANFSTFYVNVLMALVIVIVRLGEARN